MQRNCSLLHLRNIKNYAAGLRQAGVTRLETKTLPHSGEYAPEEAPEELVAELRRFRASLT